MKWPRMESLKDYLTEHGWEDAGEIAARYIINGWYSVFEYHAEDPNDENDKKGNQILDAIRTWEEAAPDGQQQARDNGP